VKSPHEPAEHLRSQKLSRVVYIASHDLNEPSRLAYAHAKFLMEDHRNGLLEGGV
jgi:light-regulated signal transduction histidine kinase (bacteriophytochrome)